LPSYSDPESEAVTISCVNCDGGGNIGACIFTNTRSPNFSCSPELISSNRGPVTITPTINLNDVNRIDSNTTFTITINKNIRPVIDTSQVNLSFPALETNTFDFSSTISDTDSSSLTSELYVNNSNTLPRWITYDGSTHILYLTNPPTTAESETHTLKINVMDECTTYPTSSSDFILDITYNYPPTITGSITPPTVYKGQGLITFSIDTLTITDPENDFQLSVSSK
jgi:hypothetical protein